MNIPVRDVTANQKLAIIDCDIHPVQRAKSDLAPFMEARWRTAGHATELRIWPEAPHGFISLPMTVADAALAAEHDFLRRTLHADPG